MSKDSSPKDGKKVEDLTMVTSLENQDINLVMDISRDKILLGIASLMVAGCGFLITMLGILLGTLWFYHDSASHLWWIMPVIAIIFTFCLLILLMEIDKTRRKCEQKCLTILRKNQGNAS